MKITLIGAGKTGGLIKKCALEEGHEIVYTITSENRNDWDKVNNNNTDVLIEFTHATAAPEHIRIACDKNIPIVCGSTGWHDALSEIKDFVLKNNGTLLYSSNFSIGVNILFAVTGYCSRIMNQFRQYSVHIEETHHTQKKDAPSGTAITLAERILQFHHGYDNWQLNGALTQESLPIQAIRKGDVPGIHEVLFESKQDILALKHEAYTREGFALGALYGAQWILGKKGVFTTADVFNFEQNLL